MKVIDWPTLDGLIQNLAFLVAGVTAIVFTYPAGHRQDTPGALALRYVLTVTLGIYLTFKGIVFPGDLRFDFRSVVVAIVARRYGAGPALLVALPIAGFRLGLGSGVGAWLGILQMTVVALVGATGTGWWRLHAPFMDEPVTWRWWRPFALFAAANVTLFPAFGTTWTEALPAYLLSVILSAVGLFVAFEIKHNRLQNLAHTSHLTQLATVDSLTGALNRRQFDLDLSTLDPAQPAFVLMLDLDHFKRINDSYGHAVGDRVLVALADLIRESTRASDCLYRLGGEEFAVVLHEGTLDDAQEVADRVRRAVEHELAARVGLHGERITCSGGLAPVVGDRHRAVQVADRHLYRAKQAGRNRVHG